MSKNCYPTLLNKKATMLGSLTRYDLVVVGMSCMILSWLKVSGIYSLIINALVLILIKTVKGKFQEGFLINLNGDRLLSNKEIQKLLEREGV